MLKLTFARICLVSTLVAAPLAAVAAVQMGDVLGSTEEQIQAAMEQSGYQVEEIETEDSMIKVEIMVEGVEREILVDPATGAVVAMEYESPEEQDDEDLDDEEEDEEADDKEGDKA